MIAERVWMEQPISSWSSYITKTMRIRGKGRCIAEFTMPSGARAEAAATAFNVALKGSDEQLAALQAALAAIPGVDGL